MSDKPPKYDLRAATRDEVVALFEAHHGYKSLSASMTYCFAVFEDGKPIAAYAWQPPPPGAAKSVCPEAPQGVLSLSRMVAVGKESRRLKHIGKPLRRQMNHAIDRTRWPVLVTYSDEGQGHNGFVYECSGWTPTVRNKRPVNENADGARCSSYSNGKHGKRALTRVGTTWIQRWEARACPPGEALIWMTLHGWTRVAVPGKRWANGKQAHLRASRAMTRNNPILTTALRPVRGANRISMRGTVRRRPLRNRSQERSESRMGPSAFLYFMRSLQKGRSSLDIRHV